MPGRLVSISTSSVMMMRERNRDANAEQKGGNHRRQHDLAQCCHGIEVERARDVEQQFVEQAVPIAVFSRIGQIATHTTTSSLRLSA